MLLIKSNLKEAYILVKVCFYIAESASEKILILLMSKINYISTTKAEVYKDLFQTVDIYKAKYIHSLYIFICHLQQMYKANEGQNNVKAWTQYLIQHWYKS